MSQHAPTTTSGVWNGTLELDVRNGRDWSAGTIELTAGPGTVEFRHHGRVLDRLDRAAWRAWLRRLDDDDTGLERDAVRWTRTGGLVRMWVGASGYRFDPDDVEHLRAVI